MVRPKKNREASGTTLRDVMTHMRGMEERLTNTIDGVEKNLSIRIDENTRGIAQNTAAIHDLRSRIDALDEDLTATIKDTVKIRQHVGMSTLEE